MDLHETIRYFNGLADREEIVKDDGELAAHYRKTAEWLTELLRYRAKDPEVSAEELLK